MPEYPMSLEDAYSTRLRVWRDKAIGKITQAELYAVLTELRKRHGEEIYLRNH